MKSEKEVVRELETKLNMMMVEEIQRNHLSSVFIISHSIGNLVRYIVTSGANTESTFELTSTIIGDFKKGMCKFLEKMDFSSKEIADLKRQIMEIK